jgi:predicted nuclease of predicted toxin-antitoxin system
MRFLIDASLPRSAANTLRALGHEPVDVRDIGLGGATDETIADHARRNRQALVTRDFDFADIRNYPPEEYSGIVVVDLPSDSTAPQILKALETFARTTQWLELLERRLAIVEPSRVRFRPAP